ncbi:MAG: hypothetical protein RI556_00655 [Hydrogenovibrio sp.]|jgi:hypothetical protein|uniref:hypothetical protein n=1 Tax=Hydrogenovibrio TaxID=28884 RepID=UPI0003798807|nr:MULTISPECIES: hypothetical protein [Hydrogenovibrio]MDR9497665.1 hypothetical protein [Hydrogenovibrio sp.]
MEINGQNAAYQAMQGMNDGFQRLNQNAQVLATPAHPDQAESLVNLNQNETQVQSSAKALKAHDDMLGTLIDIMA